MFEIRSRRLQVARVLSAVGDPAAGAIVVFTGTTRRTNAGRRVVPVKTTIAPAAGSPTAATTRPTRKRLGLISYTFTRLR